MTAGPGVRASKDIKIGAILAEMEQLGGVIEQ
jgi:hypothetical protein